MIIFKNGLLKAKQKDTENIKRKFSVLLPLAMVLQI